MISPPQINIDNNIDNRNKNTLLPNSSIEDLKEYKINACDILRKHDQYATAKIIEELIDQEIMSRKIIEEWNKISEVLPEYIGV